MGEGKKKRKDLSKGEEFQRSYGEKKRPNRRVRGLSKNEKGEDKGQKVLKKVFSQKLKMEKGTFERGEGGTGAGGRAKKDKGGRGEREKRWVANRAGRKR